MECIKGINEGRTIKSGGQVLCRETQKLGQCFLQELAILTDDHVAQVVTDGMHADLTVV